MLCAVPSSSNGTVQNHLRMSEESSKELVTSVGNKEHVENQCRT